MLKPLIATLPLGIGGEVLIESQVLSQIMAYRQLAITDTEAGGILIGYRRGPHLHIVDLSVPQKADLRRRFGFDRNDSKHQKIALDRWKESGKRLDYLGEWHTHPQRCPQPSPIDEAEWKKLIAASPEPMIFLIAGTEDKFWVGVGHREELHATT